MKSFKLSIILATTLVASGIAYAGQENSGASLCSRASVVCSSNPDPTQSVDVCVFDSNSNSNTSPATVFVMADQNGNDQSNRYSVSRIVDTQSMGAPLRYEGNDMQLLIQATVAPRPEGFPGLLNVPALGIRDLNLACRFRSGN